MKTTKLPLTPHTVKIWRHPLISDADISEMPIAFAADVPPGGDRDAIERVLLEATGQLPLPEVIEAVNRELERLSYSRAACGIRRMFRMLPATPKTVALQIVILGDELSTREAAKMAHCSQSAVVKEVKRLRQVFTHLQ